MRTLAIGDIHGCYQSLAALESLAKFKPEDRIITLGDYVDRGPDSKSVIEWLIDRNANGNLIALRGNHELMMLAATQSERHLDEWLACGGDTVLSSYGADAIDTIPGSHLSFLRLRLRSHFKTKHTSSFTPMLTQRFHTTSSQTSCCTGNRLAILCRTNPG
ncbi:metallophosphoesterase family protein [Rhodopirellula baltica]|uniref:Serine/threonine protein phosphatase n=1 Tax=Rhodopirellula baltica WH47 TaxID=991778 RepID=F2AYY9_RHOBT|nr:metallophosphoesterase family protein [Rhodopirellula baltica]EGF25122.1 serine/threonine protein phosphatase [Rhodopirellula baltica WH47]